MSAALQRAVNLLTRSVGHIALNPVVTAALLWLLTQAPLSVRRQLQARIAALRDPACFAKVTRALKWCLALGAAGVLNRQLNHVAMNAGRLRSEKARWDWKSEVAVITGGSGGIGALVVRRLVDQGVRVAVVDVQELPESLRGYANIKFFACDITNPTEVYATADRIREQLGDPSILINNAGIMAPHTILDTPDDFLKNLFAVNVLSNWYTVKAFLPAMVARNKGHIVTVASLASYVGIASLADYTASKAAILSFHEALAQELKLHHHAPNILTTSVHPSWVRTPLAAPVESALQAQGEAMMDPALVADAVVQCIVSCAGGQVFLPSGMGKVSLLRGMPNWVQEG